MRLLGRHIGTAWEAFLIMQQHGFPTRFLDWTFSLSAAAFFAARSWNDPHDAAVWIMAPHHLMDLRGDPEFWRTVVGDPRIAGMAPRSDATGLEEFNAQSPILLSPDQVVSRIPAQSGVYTLHTFRRNALEELANSDRMKHGNACFLSKIVIPAAHKVAMLSELEVLSGVSEETMFPDLDGFGRAFVSSWLRKIKREYSAPTL
jgi:hypothetical protein